MLSSEVNHGYLSQSLSTDALIYKTCSQEPKLLRQALLFAASGVHECAINYPWSEIFKIGPQNNFIYDEGKNNQLNFFQIGINTEHRF